MNQIARHGSAAMPMISTLRLPYCSALINGKGPYRLIVDTGEASPCRWTTTSPRSSG